MTDLTIEFPDHISAGDTPRGMADRIPPHEKTTIPVKIGPNMLNTLLGIEVTGMSADNGTAGFNKDQEPELFRGSREGFTRVFDIIGGSQTKPTADGKGGNAGKLTLAVKNWGGRPKVLKQSTGFSVAAIPTEVKMEQPVGMNNSIDKADPDAPDWEFFWGTRYHVVYVSDSGDATDLEAVSISEKITPAKGADGRDDASGVVKAIFDQFDVSGFLPVSQQAYDYHGPSVPHPKKDANGRAYQRSAAYGAATAAVKDLITTKGNGTGKLLQYLVFLDQRTGATDEKAPLTVRDAGFAILWEIEKKDGRYLVRISKKPEANNGTAAGKMSKDDTAQKEVTIN
jgi:hypothetical protein